MAKQLSMSEICRGCGLRHGNAASCQEAELRRDRKHLVKLRRAVRWALGELGDFPQRPANVFGTYWWRTELRRRAGAALKKP
jgi:hypothetical protein